MQNIRFFLAASFSLATCFAGAQNKEIVLGYINAYKDIAVAEMQRTGVPASIKLAQGIHETLAGTSELVIKSNNHFGIKCKATWTGESVYHDDDLRGECFRKYNSATDSYRDHSNFLKGSPRYGFLFKLDPLDYSAWAYGLKNAGYATNPKYPQIIIKLIEDYNLQEYTLVALGKAPSKDESFAKATGDNNNTGVSAAVMTQNEPANEVNPDQGSAFVQNPEYPEREFKINDTRVIFARQGISFLSIASQYNVSLARIFEFNDMQEKEALEKDQLIYLQRKRRTGNNEFHIVKPGESLHDVAQEEAIRMEALLEYNQLQNYMRPAPGAKLYLKTKAPARPMLVAGKGAEEQVDFARNERTVVDNDVNTKSSAEGYLTHIVLPRETVYSISKKYSVRITDIAEWNQLSSYELKRGQQLRIYK